MSSVERARIAMKYGADDATAQRVRRGLQRRRRAGPRLLVHGPVRHHWGNYGATHPAVQAHATMGRKMFDIVNAAGLAATDAVTLEVEQEALNGDLVQ